MAYWFRAWALVSGSNPSFMTYKVTLLNDLNSLGLDFLIYKIRVGILSPQSCFED